MRAVASIVALLLLPTARVLAQEAPAAASLQTPVSTLSAECKTRSIEAVPLAVSLTPQGVFAAVPEQFGAAAHACVGSAPTAPSTQPFTSGYPFPGAWWSTGAYPYPLPPYRGP